MVWRRQSERRYAMMCFDVARPMPPAVWTSAPIGRSHGLGWFQCWQLNKTALKQFRAWNPTGYDEACWSVYDSVCRGRGFLVDMFKQSVTGLSLHGIIQSGHVLGPSVNHRYLTIRGEKGWQLHRQREELYAVTVESAGLSIYLFYPFFGWRSKMTHLCQGGWHPEPDMLWPDVDIDRPFTEIWCPTGWLFFFFHSRSVSWVEMGGLKLKCTTSFDYAHVFQHIYIYINIHTYSYIHITHA